MTRVKRIGSLTLSHPLWVVEHEEIAEVIAEQELTVAGAVVQWVTTRQNPALTLDSKGNEYLTIDERDAIMQMYRDIGTEWEIEDTDGATYTAIFDYTNEPTFSRAKFGVPYYYAKISMILKG